MRQSSLHGIGEESVTEVIGNATWEEIYAVVNDTRIF